MPGLRLDQAGMSSTSCPGAKQLCTKSTEIQGKHPKFDSGLQAPSWGCQLLPDRAIPRDALG